MIPIYLAPVIFILLLFANYYWEYKRLETISKKLDEIFKGQNITSNSLYRSHSSNSAFDQAKLVPKIEKQIDLLLKKYNLSFIAHNYSSWAIYINSRTVYESINRKLDKIILLLSEDKVVFQKIRRSRLFINNMKILTEIDKKLDIIRDFNPIEFG